MILLCHCTPTGHYCSVLSQQATQQGLGLGSAFRGWLTLDGLDSLTPE